MVHIDVALLHKWKCISKCVALLVGRGIHSVGALAADLRIDFEIVEVDKLAHSRLTHALLSAMRVCVCIVCGNSRMIVRIFRKNANDVTAGGASSSSAIIIKKQYLWVSDKHRKHANRASVHRAHIECAWKFILVFGSKWNHVCTAAVTAVQSARMKVGWGEVGYRTPCVYVWPVAIWRIIVRTHCVRRTSSR